MQALQFIFSLSTINSFMKQPLIQMFQDHEKGQKMIEVYKIT
jgi:hypothetical protein